MVLLRGITCNKSKDNNTMDYTIHTYIQRGRGWNERHTIKTSYFIGTDNDGGRKCCRHGDG